MKTLAKYHELKKKLGEYFSTSNGFFFAFNKEQFTEGQKAIKCAGWLNDSEKLCRIQGGGFATKRAIEKYIAFSDKIREQIKNECSSQEIYNYEYCNFESAIACDGDLDAMKVVLDYFGKDELLKIKRKHAAYYTIEEIINDKN